MKELIGAFAMEEGAARALYESSAAARTKLLFVWEFTLEEPRVEEARS